MNESTTWLLIALCLTQSAILSGLNLAVFRPSRVRPEALAARGDLGAVRLLSFRRDSNLTLVTILWGNVGINAILAILSNSILTGAAALAVSTVAITLLGEIVPQAYSSRHSLKVVRRLAPVLWTYRVLLYPISQTSPLSRSATDHSSCTIRKSCWAGCSNKSSFDRGTPRTT